MSVLAGETQSLVTGTIEGIPQNMFGSMDLLSGSVTKAISLGDILKGLDQKLIATNPFGFGKSAETSSAFGAITKATGVDEFKSAFEKAGGNKARNGQGR